MKSFIYYCSIVISLTIIIYIICNWLEVNGETRTYITGLMVGYIACICSHHKQIEACNKLISEIKEIAPKL